MSVAGGTPTELPRVAQCAVDQRMDEVADWIVQMGYPFDFSSEHLPPAWFRECIELAWVRQDGGDSMALDDSIKTMVAEEGRWS